MKFFLDTANLDEIRLAAESGLLDGVTTNPSLVAKEGKPYIEQLKAVAELVDGPVSAEVIATEAPAMIEEARELAGLADNIVIKLPVGMEGLKATKALHEEGIPVNMTLIFSPNQALLAAKAGAAYVSPFVGRLDDISHEGMETVEQIVTIMDNYDYDTEVLVASVRHPEHVLQAALMGADICTIPFKVYNQLVKHPLTDIGLERFLADAKKVPR
jgi:transaldolase